MDAIFPKDDRKGRQYAYQNIEYRVGGVSIFDDEQTAQMRIGFVFVY